MTSTREIEQQIEDELNEKGYSAPRLTPEDIDNVIVAEQFHVFKDTTVTVCCLTLANGYSVVGESACASRHNFDEEIGRRIAYDDARSKIWQLEGYRLRQQINDRDE